MIRAVFFLAVGLILGGFTASYIGAPGAGSWALGVGVPVAIIAFVLWLVSMSLQGFQRNSPGVVQAAMQAGRVGLARVDDIRETGTRINDQPLCNIELTVQPQYGQAYRTRLRKILTFERRVELSPGSTHPVAILAEGQPDIDFVQSTDLADPSLLKLPVPSAASAGDLRIPKRGALRSNGKRSRPLLGTSKRWLPVRAVLYLVMVCVGITAVLLPMRSSVELSLESKETTGSWIPDMRTDPGASVALEALKKEVGHERVSSVYLYKDFVLIDAPVGPDTLNTDRWQFRGGELTNNGPVSIQPKSEKQFFKISDVDWDAFWPAAESVSDGLGKEVTNSIGIFTERDLNHDVNSDSFAENDGKVVARFSVNSPYSSTAYTMNSQGKNISKN